MINSHGRNCNQCGGFKGWLCFSINSKGINGRKSICKVCSNKSQKALYKKRKTNDIEGFRKKTRAQTLWKKYKLTEEVFDTINEYQGGVCAICGKAELFHGNLVVDHCHKTGEVRGLLCVKCNAGIGQLGDDPIIVDKALDYLYNPPYKGAYRGGRELSTYEGLKMESMIQSSSDLARLGGNMVEDE